MDEFPANSAASKRPDSDFTDKNIKKITSGEVTRKKTSLGKRLKETFIAGDLKSSLNYGVFDILLPSAKDVFLESLLGAFETLFNGKTRRRGSTPPQSGPFGHIQYNRVSSPIGMPRQASPTRSMSRLARARFDFDNIVLDNRIEAELVIERLFDLMEKYETASVAELYELLGIPSTHTDHKWGWTDLRGAGVTRSRDGYLLDLPDPISL